MGSRGPGQRMAELKQIPVVLHRVVMRHIVEHAILYAADLSLVDRIADKHRQNGLEDAADRIQRDCIVAVSAVGERRLLVLDALECPDVWIVLRIRTLAPLCQRQIRLTGLGRSYFMSVRVSRPVSGQARSTVMSAES